MGKSVKRGKKRYPYRTTKFKEDLVLFDLSGFDFKRTSAELYKGHYAMLNNQQLNNTIDSLKNKLSEKTLQIRENIEGEYNYTLAKNEEKIEGSISDTSSIKKIRIYDYALNKLRALKSVTNTANSDLEYRSYIIRKHRIEWHRKIALAIACIILFLVGAPLGTIIKKGGFGMPVMVSVFFFVFYHVINIIGEKAAKEATLSVVEGMWLANFIFLPIAIFLIYKTSKEITFLDYKKYTNFFEKLLN